MGNINSVSDINSNNTHSSSSSSSTSTPSSSASFSSSTDVPDPQSLHYISDKFHLASDKQHQDTPSLEYHPSFKMMETELKRHNGFDKLRGACQHTVVQHKGLLFCYGGKTVNTVGAVKATSDISIFSLDDERWLVEKNVGYIREDPQPRWGHTAVILDHRMVVYGGQNQRSRDPLQKSVLAFFNLDTCLWEDETKYRIQGGINNTNNCGGRILHSAVVLPATANPSPNQTLISRATPVMIVFAGLKGTGEIKRSNDLWLMEQLENDQDGFRWLNISTAGRTPPRMVGQRAAILPASHNTQNDDLMIIYGGNPCLAHGVFILNCSTWTWDIRVTVDSPMCPMMLFSHSIAIHNQYLISVGGYGSTGHPTILALNLNTGKYVAEVETSVSIGSRIDSAVYIDSNTDQLYVINGLSNNWNALRNDIAIIDLPELHWTPQSHASFPLAFRQAVFTILMMASRPPHDNQVIGNTGNDTSSDNESLTDSEVDEELQLITSVSKKQNNTNSEHHIINMRDSSSSSSTASLSSLVIQDTFGDPEFFWWDLPDEVIHKIIGYLGAMFTFDFSDLTFDPELEPFQD